MTPYSSVFKAFLAEIKDTYFAVGEDPTAVAVAEDHMISLLHKAIVGFSYPKVNIRDFDDELMRFNVDLDIDEIEILAAGMVLSWARTEMYNGDILTQTMTTKDFNTYSQAPHINALARVVEHTEKRFKRMLVKYSIRRKTGGDFLGGLGETIS